MSPRSDEPELVEGFVRSLTRFLAESVDPVAIDRQHRIPPEVIGGLADLGVFGLSIPEAHGGAGFSLHGVCEVVAKLAERDRSVAVTCGLHLGLGTRGLVAFGSEDLKARFLPQLASGETVAAFATTEAGAGSDLGAIRTTARLDGDGLRIDGEKIYVTNGGLAGLFTITASTPTLAGGRRGHSLVVLTRDDPGVSVGAEEDKLGLRGNSTTTLSLDGARVPRSRVVGEEGKGMTQLQHVLAWGRTTMAAGCVGAARQALARVIEQVTTRAQFGKKLGELDVVRGQVADLAALLFATEALVFETARAEDDWGLLARRSTAAKIFASEANGELADLAVQLHGGAGFIEETGVPLLLRDARITRIFEGANDVLATHLGAMEVTAPVSRSSFETEGGSVNATGAEALAGAVDDARTSAKAEHGVKLLRRPAELHRLGRLAVLREATDAAARRARQEATPEAAALAEHWQHLARGRARLWLERLADEERVRSITHRLFEEVAA